jgi:cytoskeletal protein CcmA (bactofilin family)
LSQPAQQNPGSIPPALIGKGMIVKGRVHSGQDLVVNGEVEGDLDVENCRLTIGPEGKAAANTRAREVDISGTLTGNVESSEKTCIRSSGRLTGDVRTRGIVIEEGALFKGKVEILGKSEQEHEVRNGN